MLYLMSLYVNAVVATATSVKTTALSQSRALYDMSTKSTMSVPSRAAANATACSMKRRPRRVLYHGENEYKIGRSVAENAPIARHTTVQISRYLVMNGLP